MTKLTTTVTSSVGSQIDLYTRPGTDYYCCRLDLLQPHADTNNYDYALSIVMVGLAQIGTKSSMISILYDSAKIQIIIWYNQGYSAILGAGLIFFVGDLLVFGGIDGLRF